MEACNMTVCGQCTQQSDSMDPHTAFRRGKLQELASMVQETGADGVVFLNRISVQAAERIADICGVDVDHHLQGWLLGRLLQLLADEVGGGRKPAAVGDGAAVSPVQHSPDAVIFGQRLDGQVDGAFGLPLGETDTGLEMVARIFAQHQSGLYEFVVIAQVGEIAFHTHTPSLVVEIAFDGGMGIDG